MSLGIIRDGKPVTIDVTLEQSAQTRVASGNIYTGIEGAELSNTRVGNVKGVKVDSVKAGSAAARIGLEKGDVIRREPTADPEPVSCVKSSTASRRYWR